MRHLTSTKNERKSAGNKMVNSYQHRISNKFSAYRRPPSSASSPLQLNLDRKSNMQGNNSSSNVARIFVKTSQ